MCGSSILHNNMLFCMEFSYLVKKGHFMPLTLGKRRKKNNSLESVQNM